MDMTASIAPRSDQINADDLLTGPVTVTISEVTEGAAEQPFDFHLIEYPGRAYRPSKSMRRVIVKAWGGKTEAYHGKRLTIFNNPEIMFGRDKTGGIEISHLSDIPKAFTMPLTKTRGRKNNFTVKPLAALVQDVVRDWQAEMDAVTDTAALSVLYAEMRATPGAYTDELQAAFGDRGAALKVTAAPEQTEGDAA
jgi:hypothetical protein